jgi:hypothetical protein
MVGFPAGGKEFFSAPQSPDRLWGSPSPLINRCTEGSFPGGEKVSDRRAKLTTYFHLLPRLKMGELYLHSPYVFMTLYLIKHSCTCRVQTGSGGHLDSYPIGTRSSFHGGKAAGAWSWPLASIYCRGWERGSYTSTPPFIFMTYLIKHSCTCQVQTGSGAHPASYPTRIGSSFHGGKAAGT